MILIIVQEVELDVFMDITLNKKGGFRPLLIILPLLFLVFCLQEQSSSDIF